MAENQGTRIVTCSKHGIPYDANQRGGCVRCIREWDQQKKTKSGGGGVPGIVKVLGLVVVVGAGIYLYNSWQAATSTPPEAPAADAPAVSVADVQSSAALREIVDDLPELMRIGRTQIEHQLTDQNDPEQRKESWGYWADDWESRIARLTAKLPAAPDSRANLEMAIAFQELNRALNELRSLRQATEDDLPAAAKIERHFEKAQKSFDKAHAQLAKIK